MRTLPSHTSIWPYPNVHMCLRMHMSDVGQNNRSFIEFTKINIYYFSYFKIINSFHPNRMQSAMQQQQKSVIRWLNKHTHNFNGHPFAQILIIFCCPKRCSIDNEQLAAAAGQNNLVFLSNKIALFLFIVQPIFMLKHIFRLCCNDSINITFGNRPRP